MNTFDNITLCEFWTEIGECDNNPVWMLANCELSCGCVNYTNENVTTSVAPSSAPSLGRIIR